MDVPSDVRFLQVLRVFAAAACAEVLDDFQRLDDVRLALDELAATAISGAAPSSRLRVRVWPHDQAIHLEGRVPANGALPELSDVGRMLVTTIARTYRLVRDGRDVLFELVIDVGR